MSTFNHNTCTSFFSTKNCNIDNIRIFQTLKVNPLIITNAQFQESNWNFRDIEKCNFVIVSPKPKVYISLYKFFIKK